MNVCLSGTWIVGTRGGKVVTVDEEKRKTGSLADTGKRHAELGISTAVPCSLL